MSTTPLSSRPDNSPAARSKRLASMIARGGLPDVTSDLDTQLTQQPVAEPAVPPVGRFPVEPAAPPVVEPVVTPVVEPPAAKVEPAPPVSDDPFAPTELTPKPETPPPGEAPTEAHKRAQATLRAQVEKAVEEKRVVETELTTTKARMQELETELNALRANPGAPVFKPVTHQDIIAQPDMVKRLDKLSREINTVLGNVTDETAAAMEPKMKDWIAEATGIDDDAGKRRAFIQRLETEFPREDVRGMANGLISAAAMSKEISDEAARIMAEPAQTGMRLARTDWETRRTALDTTLKQATAIKGTALEQRPFHPLTYISSLTEADPKWKARSDASWKETLEVFSGVEPLVDGDAQALTGAFEESAGKTIAERREAHEKRIRPAMVQLYAIKMLTPLIETAMEALAEKMQAEQQTIDERRAVSASASTVVPVAEPKATPAKVTPISILRETGLYPAKAR